MSTENKVMANLDEPFKKLLNAFDTRGGRPQSEQRCKCSAMTAARAQSARASLLLN